MKDLNKLVSNHTQGIILGLKNNKNTQEYIANYLNNSDIKRLDGKPFTQAFISEALIAMGKRSQIHSRSSKITNLFSDAAPIDGVTLNQAASAFASLNTTVTNQIEAISQPLTKELVKHYLEVSSDSSGFPINFNDAWQWIDYSRKDNALRVLKENFIESTDYILLNQEGKSNTKPSSQYMLTTDCFKEFSMLAQTEKGKQIRLYFIQCEKELKAIKQSVVTPAPIVNFSTLDLFEASLKALRDQEGQIKTLTAGQEQLSKGQAQLTEVVTTIKNKLDNQETEKQNLLKELSDCEYSDKLPLEVPIRKNITAIVNKYIFLKYPNPTKSDYSEVWGELDRQIYKRLGKDIKTRYDNYQAKGIKKTRLDIMSDLNILNEVYDIVSLIFRIDQAS